MARVEGNLQLLFARQRHRILVIRDIEVGHHAGDALPLLPLDLLFCLFPAAMPSGGNIGPGCEHGGIRHRSCWGTGRGGLRLPSALQAQCQKHYLPGGRP